MSSGVASGLPDHPLVRTLVPKGRHDGVRYALEHEDLAHGLRRWMPTPIWITHLLLSL